MSGRPERPKIYHITHVDNLAAIVRDGGLISDRAMLARGGPTQMIGMSAIKQRRIEKLEVHCHKGSKVGDYVPFYFCPRSIMLYVIHCANHPGLAYRGGQEPIVHLEADLQAVVARAGTEKRRWAFSRSNAGANYAEFRASLADLEVLDWDAIGASDFRSAEVKERKQAEFLFEERFAFDLVDRIGVHSDAIRGRVAEIISRSGFRPVVEVRPEWYF
ncbi:MAG: DUF4433 domain-containing protein [Planctomycetes bacterium]|nr:DUF4433 domain-containing protein [Planctomycetota bacterium]MBI3845286.1 DUF4433 domain-containing protein [Planctomycetota bacterium]